MSIARFRLAVDRRRKQGEDAQADFIPCTAFGKNAEFIEKYFRKGMRVLITGRIQTGSYTNKDGVKVYTTEIIVEENEFADGKADGNSSSSSSTTPPADGFMPIPDGVDEELPFA